MRNPEKVEKLKTHSTGHKLQIHIRNTH